MTNKQIIVIGGGAAGMVAAGAAAEGGAVVTLLERNAALGRKLAITGKGRCNLTNAAPDVETIIKNVPTNGTFLYSALHGFSNFDTIGFFNKLGLPTKVERGDRVFPASDRAADVVAALEKYVKDSGVKIVTGRASRILTDGGGVAGVVTEDGITLPCGAAVIATGGMSYSRTGSAGDGYALAKALGHTIIPPKPSLVPLAVEEGWVRRLQGLSLKNAAVKVLDVAGKTVYTDFGEMLFTHFGVSGPIILSASAHMRKAGEKYKIEVDIKPALSEEQLDARVLRDFARFSNRDFSNSLNELLPKAMVDIIIELSEIPPDRKVHSITKEQRKRLCGLLKRLTMTVAGFRDIEEAIITSGGVSVREINPATMESKLIRGLYFAGEVIDVDAYTGGFNLQIAFSTGRLAGLSLLATKEP